MSAAFKKFITKLPGVKAVDRSLRRHYTGRSDSRYVSPRSYYAPLPDIDAVCDQAERIFRKDVTFGDDIDIRRDSQLLLLEKLARFAADFDWPEDPEPNHRFFFNQKFFLYGDAFILYAMLRHLEPARVTEIGSGFSSALMLDTRDRFLEKPVHFTFIEPFPKRLLSTFRGQDHQTCTLIDDVVQSVSPSRFAELQSGDVLFVDSSHVAKVGSDVNFILFEVLPVLQSGVVVHFHDIPWPFEYPESWVRMGRAWNEAYLLRAFLQYNDAYEILLFNSYCAHEFRPFLEQRLPIFLNFKESLPRFLREPFAFSIWLRKR